MAALVGAQNEGVWVGDDICGVGFGGMHGAACRPVAAAVMVHEPPLKNGSVSSCVCGRWCVGARGLELCVVHVTAVWPLAV